jgi:hypothetical protein
MQCHLINPKTNKQTHTHDKTTMCGVAAEWQWHSYKQLLEVPVAHIRQLISLALSLALCCSFVYKYTKQNSTQQQTTTTTQTKYNIAASIPPNQYSTQPTNQPTTANAINAIA